MTAEEYGEAYERSFRSMVYLMYRRGVDTDSATEHVQSAWVHCWSHLDQLRDDYCLIPWVKATAWNLFVNSRRDKWRMRRDEMPRDVEHNYDPLSERIDAKTILDKAFWKDRDLLVDYYLKGMDTAELSEKYRWPLGSTRTKLWRARESACNAIKSQRTPLRPSNSTARQ